MPFSSKEGKTTVREWASEYSDLINVVVDVGAGNGTYIHLLREKRKTLANAIWIAIEVWKPYIEEYNLKNRYDDVISQDVRDLNWKEFDKVDLVILGDVLEHITKDEAQQLVDRIFETAKYAVISIPIVHCPQGEEFGNPYEIHVKDDWSHSEVMETFKKYIKKYKIDSTIGVYWLEK